MFAIPLLKSMSTKKIQGICKLTGLQGPYVSSHLIPRALIRLSQTGEKAIQAGYGFGKAYRYEGWYDNKLVIRKGEDLLAKIDSDAIKYLRSLKLVWSGWGDENCLEDVAHDLGSGHGIRSLLIEDHHCLQLFFLSLLWRAGASSRPEFSDVALSDLMLEDLRQRIVALDAGNYEDYPVSLHQLGSRGPAHNRTPFTETQSVPIEDGLSLIEVTYVRFYFDGLIAYIYLPIDNSFFSDIKLTCLGLGSTKMMPVFVHSFEKSRALSNLVEIIEAHG